jgi:hypothetical protein
MPTQDRAKREQPNSLRLALEWEPQVRNLNRLAGIGPRNSWVEVTDGTFTARFGPWRVRTPVANIKSTEVTGPYHLVRVAGGPRLSLGDQGLTFAGTTRRGLCLTFHEPVRGIGLLRHPELTVTVTEPDRLTAALEESGAVLLGA